MVGNCVGPSFNQHALSPLHLHLTIMVCKSSAYVQSLKSSQVINKSTQMSHLYFSLAGSYNNIMSIRYMYIDTHTCYYNVILQQYMYMLMWRISVCLNGLV